MHRIRFILIALLLTITMLPVLYHHPVHAQDEETGQYDDNQGDPASDGAYQEQPTYEDTSQPENEWPVGTEATPDEADLSSLPQSPYRPVDFSPFTEALAKITPERMAELESMIVEANIVQLEELMDSGKLTSQELLLFYVDRIQKYDVGQLNAITQLNPDALYDAHLRDVQRKNGESKGPLQGIPVLLKENIATGDSEATTAGAIALADAPAQHDAYLVRQLLNSGAVILGKTNMTEWANWMHMSFANGYSAFGGQTVSPFGDDPSGSSTGNAVAITANFAPLAIGTETIGSIISPASRESVVGMHPTTGLISGENIIPLSPTLDTAGPMGKTVSDIAVAMSIFAEELDPSDPRSKSAQPVAGADFLAALDPNALQGVRVGIVPVDPSYGPDDVLAMYNGTGAIDALQAAGAEVVVVYPSGMPDIDWWQLIACGMREGIDNYLKNNGITDPGSLADIIAINNTNPDVYIPLGQARLEEAQWCDVPAADLNAMMDGAISTAQAYLDDLFASNEVDVLITTDDTFTLEYGLAGYPAITVPRGTYDGYTPTNFTFVGPRCSDVDLVGYAYAFEQTGDYRIVPELTVRPPQGDQATPDGQ